MKISICALFFLMALSVFSQTAHACLCIPPKNPYRVSKVVFFGEVVEIQQTDLRSTRVVRFKVEKYWKGVNEESINVTTTAVFPCGYGFSVGEKYLVYAGEENGQLETSPCRILAEDLAGKDLKKLGKGKTPKSISSRSHNAQRKISAQVSAGSLLIRLRFPLGFAC